MRKTILLLPFAALLAGAVAAAPGLPLLAPKYKEIPVAGGGTIQGVVKIDPVPAVAEFAVGKDQQTCHATKPNHRLSVDGETKGVGSAVVYLEGIEAGKALPSGVTATIDQKECVYSPFVTVVPAKSDLGFTSSDPILHNVHVFEGDVDNPHSLKRDVFNSAMKDNKVPRQTLEARDLRKPALFFVRCDAGHVWMSAYIWVVDHPYYAVTDSKGAFELKDVPPGRYTLRFWHPGWTATPQESDGQVTGYSYGAPLQHSASVDVTANGTTKIDWAMPGG